MKTIKQMSCGNCGCDDFRIYSDNDDGLVVECIKCSSTTIIKPSKPVLEMSWGDNSDGILCHLKNND